MKYDLIAEAYKKLLKESSEHPMIEVDGVMRHRHNSLGQPIHHTDEGIKNFHRWASNDLVTDEHGRPKVFYHGTKHADQIDTFRPGGVVGSTLTGDAYGVGTYLSTSPREASSYAGSSGSVYPVYAKGNILDMDAEELPKEHQENLTKFANENMLDSDKGRFPSITRKTAKFSEDELDDAREFFENKKKDHEVFGGGYDRNFPTVDKIGDKFHISYVDYSAPVQIKSGQDAQNLLKAVGYDQLSRIGFDGLKMKRDGGAEWLVMHSPEYNTKSAIGNIGEFSKYHPTLMESLS
jgi:hypothetical protein